ncbi:MAG: hypothetical protein EKK61_05565 [Rickettsiales bacterium]|nr:MAG: hypothetical protein EKK61_05565 [Rickettsiales bacterium]
MDNIKDTKLLTSSLDIKTNVGKTLSENFLQLQSGAQMIATVVKKSVSGETVLNTVYGRMITDNKFNLSRGDIVNIKLSNVGNNLSGNVMSINNEMIEQDNSIILKLFGQMFPLQNIASDLINLFPIDQQNLSMVPEEITGIISYLNLSKMDKTTTLYKIFEEMEIPSSKNIPISLKVVANSLNHTKDNFLGIVSGNDTNGSQLIKTEFGIVTSDNTEMQIGQKLFLSITNLNNKPIANVLLQNITNLIEDIADNMPNFDEIMKTVNIFHHLNRRRQSQNSYNFKDKNNIENTDKPSKIELLKETIENKASNVLEFHNIIKLMNNSEVKKIIHEYSEIKRLLQSEDDQVFDADWQTILIPIYINNKPEKQQFKIKRNGNLHLQFIVDIKFIQNPMQIDGNIVFETKNQKPKSFDMVLRSEYELEPNLKKHIMDIFNKNQNITGINGSLVIMEDRVN